MPSLGGWELVILIGILVLLFGAKRLPDMARSIGQSARVFKGEMKGMKSDEATSGTTDKPAATTQPATAQPGALPQPPAASSVQEPAPQTTPTAHPGRGTTGQ
jgi:sec-independent protein translocase protein TatA